MSSSHHILNLNPNLSLDLDSIFHEKQWVIYIQQTLDEELKEEIETLVHIFTVPKTLMAINPDSYIPQQVAIGPYHCARPEIHETERYKLAAAKRYQRRLQDIKLQQVVDNLVEMEPKIRACYHNVLSFSTETLAWMMVLDASFLLEFLQVCDLRQVNNNNVVTSTLWHLVGLLGNKAIQNTILRDISMLENQIPLFVLIKLLEFQFSSLEEVDEMFFHMLLGFCKEVSPFRMDQGLDKFQVRECAHLLDALYCSCVPKLEGFSIEEVIQVIIKDGEDQEPLETSNDCDRKETFLHKVWVKICNFHGQCKSIKKMISSKSMKIIKLPWICLSNLPILKVIKEPIENFFRTLVEENQNNIDGSSKTSSGIINKPLLLEEITIPSVTELAKAGVHFVPTAGGISTTTFDNKKIIFYLPIITLDTNTEIILRNLIAYEACIESGPLILARYIELMNGIIDTEEDARFLRQRGIIVNHMKSDQEVANLWNGMTKCIRLTKVPFLDKVIDDVNRHYNGRWRIKFEKAMKRSVYGSWRLLTFLACVLMLLVVGLQAFCSVYSCARVAPIKILS